MKLYRRPHIILNLVLPHRGLVRFGAADFEETVLVGIQVASRGREFDAETRRFPQLERETLSTGLGVHGDCPVIGNVPVDAVRA